MKTIRLPLISFLLALFGALLGGCSLNTQKNSSIPWSRPASWEGQIPGMGSAPGQGR